MSVRTTNAHRQRGVALVIALLVVALAVVLIATLLDRGELAQARTRNRLREQQAYAYAQGLESYAARVLMLAEGSDSSSSPWAVPFPPTRVPGGQIVATMRDRNGCFNLNNLTLATTGPAWQQRFARLLRVLKLDPALGGAVVNWMRTGATTPDDGYYLQQAVPYRRAARQFVHVSELRLVRGVSADVFAQLAPEVCALPAGTQININSASVAVLMSLSDSLTEQDAKAIWQQGHANYMQLSSVPALVAKAPDCVAAGPTSPCDVRSDFFLARGDITLDGLVFTYYSLIERDDNAGIRVIARSRGAEW